MRIRTLKPEFWSHESLANCGDFTRLLAIALLNFSDDEGYFLANPAIVRGALFPFLDDSKIIPRAFQDLSKCGYIQLGTDQSGRAVGRVVKFLAHQRIDKPQPSKIKPCATFQDDSKNDLGKVLDDSATEGKGREEGKGTEERKGEATPPKRFSPPELSDWIAYGISLTPTFPHNECTKTYDFYTSKGWKVGGQPMKDWKAALRTCHGRWRDTTPNGSKPRQPSLPHL